MTGSIRYFITDSPIGPLLLASTTKGLCGVYMQDHRHGKQPEPDWIRDRDALSEASGQLTAYFEGKLRAFDLPLDLAGTPFQLEVWRALCGIPFGETRSYADLARAIGNAKAVRAVGLANGRNPVSIVVPCHRVIGSDGSLTGYGGGLTRKRFLLDHEARIAGRQSMALALG
jgi:methylated-DNA-[protein]-cysteine S-methyltransferase